MGNLKRGYLNREEENFVMITKAYIEYMTGFRNLENVINKSIWEEWESRGMLTSTMRKHLKLVYTYMNKFVNELHDNLDERENERLKKKIMKFDYRLVDDYTLKKVIRDINDHMRYAIMDRNKFIDVIDVVSGVECVGCKRDYKGCSLCAVFEEASIAHVGEQPNCPYAADLSEFTDEEKKDYDELIKRVKNKNQFLGRK